MGGPPHHDAGPRPPRRCARRLPLASLTLALAVWLAGGLVPGLGSRPAGAEVPAGTPGVTRGDEWTGVASGSNNMNANFGLYAFRDPATPFPRAYWTPGVGIFQYDSAGVGAPYTAAQLIDVRYVAGDVAAGMAARYCASGGSRAAAWQPWAALGGIAKSDALYQEMLAPDLPAFAKIGLVDGIEDTGGMQARTCLTNGQSLPCWYVDPTRAQGANWWATDDPTGGPVASGEAPLTAARRHAGVAAGSPVLDARGAAVLRPVAGRSQGLTAGPGRADRF